MKKVKPQIIIALSVLVLISLACSFGVSTANLKNARTTHDIEGTQPTTVFAPNEIFYCVVDLANAPDDTVVKAVWTAVEAEGMELNANLYESEITSGDQDIHFELSSSIPWPAGNYKVDLYLNEKLTQTLEFEVVSVTALQNARMTRDYEGTQPTTDYASNEIFYLVVDLVNAPDNTVVKAAWTAVEAEGIDPNTFIDEAEVTSGDQTLHFELSNTSPWPAGKYKVELYLNDELAQTLEFEVQ